MANEDADKVGVPRGVRGPSYPSMSIEEAIGKAQQLWAAEKRNAAPVEVVAKHWGYSATSSSGKMTVAALLHYGLIGDSGSGKHRMVKLTGRALDIVLDEVADSPRRLQAIKDAVGAPKLYADIMAKWPPQEGLPSDPTLRFYLLREKSFNEGSIAAFIKDFRSSIAFAKLDKTPTIGSEDTAQTDDNLPSEFAETDKVVKDQTLQAAQVEQTAKAQGSGRVAAPAIQQSAGVKQDTFSLDEGQVVLQFPEKMSADSYEDFKDWIELQLRRIKRSIPPAA
ncbi:hypothetical protein [Caenimonas soli]|uniref:hypothetical protein n=1 Tax=Caenimonas soli TaxID=2735555 RepID=UPI001551BDA1|nr:hypothetical protein [Caenimonas soli]NPC56009.1 hypothetical protein [Caenimonas soli]